MVSPHVPPPELEKACIARADSAEEADPLAAEMKNNPNWAEATKWSEETRYSLGATQTMARNLYTAVAERNRSPDMYQKVLVKEEN